MSAKQQVPTFCFIKILIEILAWVLMAASDGAEIGFCEVPNLDRNIESSPGNGKPPHEADA